MADIKEVRGEKLVVLGLTEQVQTEAAKAFVPRTKDAVRSQAWCFSRECLEETMTKQILRWNEELHGGFPALIHAHRNGVAIGEAHDPGPVESKGTIRCNASCRILFAVPTRVADELAEKRARG